MSLSGRVHSTRQVGLVGRTLGTTKRRSSARALAPLRVLTCAIEPQRREEHNWNNINLIWVFFVQIKPAPKSLDFFDRAWDKPRHGISPILAISSNSTTNFTTRCSARRRFRIVKFPAIPPNRQLSPKSEISIRIWIWKRMSRFSSNHRIWKL